MLSQLERYPMASSSCGVPVIAELIHACTVDAQPLQLEQTLIWAGLLHGLEELERVLNEMPLPMVLNPDQAMALCAAINLAGDATQANPPLYRLLADSVPQGVEDSMAAIPWMVMSQAMEAAKSSHWAEVIRQTSLLQLSDPARLFADFLAQLETFLLEKMPFAVLLRISLLFRNKDKLPAGWQLRLAESLNAFGDLADATPLYRFWMVVFQLAPEWDFAYIRAADLALRFEDFTIAEQILNCMDPANLFNPWFYDVRARCRLSHGDLKAAAHCWSAALGKTDPSSPDFQVMRDRLLLALRGKYGLGEVIRLARSGYSEKALQLLRVVTLYDPCFSRYYALLESLEDCPRQDIVNTLGKSVDLQSVERLIGRFSAFWQNHEEQVVMTTSDDSGQVLEFIRNTAVFLDSCEESVF